MMLNSSPVPYGYQFRPSRQEIFIRFLFPIVNGECLPSSPLIQVEIYGENKEPWNIFDKNSKTPYWVFTKLKKKSKLRIDRTAGSGCWLARNTKEVYDDGGKLLGYHKYFTFSCKNDDYMNLGNGHWIMHEFSLNREDSKDYVICEIRNKNATDSDSDSKLNTKKRRILSWEKNHEGMNLTSRPDDEEMRVISLFSNSDHKDLSSDVAFETRNKNYDLDLNLNLKFNDENTRFYVNHEDPKIIYKDVAGSNLNSSKLESDDEERESISRFSNSNHEDLSNDFTFGIRNRNDRLGLNLNLKSNDEDQRFYINHEDGNRHYLRQNDFDPSKLPRGRRPKNQQMEVRNMFPMSIRCKTCGKYIYQGTKFNPAKKRCGSGEREKQKRKSQGMGDAMKSLENRTLDSKREMDILAALYEMKSRKTRHATVSVDQCWTPCNALLQLKEKKLAEEDQALIKSIFEKPKEFVPRISDDVFIYDEDLTCLSNGLR
ncbi:hypothetical protein J1N35_012860 [Gossypium stocksii]|uniref:NAC domain-containing protein n=1 Tax=Gossypium stocksii TaxID=47602 RepID=A0A9D3VTQ2_9ROSI|nr:hypothetical protein J1N35_012860 [Gossypium stocksii]